VLGDPREPGEIVHRSEPHEQVVERQLVLAAVEVPARRDDPALEVHAVDLRVVEPGRREHAARRADDLARLDPPGEHLRDEPVERVEVVAPMTVTSTSPRRMAPRRARTQLRLDQPPPRQTTRGTLPLIVTLR
jgi:hypothetical protein